MSNTKLKNLLKQNNIKVVNNKIKKSDAEIIASHWSKKFWWDDDIGDFWVVLKGTPDSELDDVLFESDVSNMMLQAAGGLKREDVICVTELYDKAEKLAKDQLSGKANASTRSTPIIKNDDMVKYAKELGEYLMIAKLGILSLAETSCTKAVALGLEDLCDDINHVEQELKAWGE
jgi:hypothetical protein